MTEVWWLVDAAGGVVASHRTETALDARDEFKRQGLTGARVIRAQVAPVDETVKPALTCEVCGTGIEEARDYRLVTGWERISRGAGGTNSIRAPNRSAERFMCMFCVGKIADGVSPRQQTLV